MAFLLPHKATRSRQLLPCSWCSVNLARALQDHQGAEHRTIKTWNHRLGWVGSDLKAHPIPAPGRGRDPSQQSGFQALPNLSLAESLSASLRSLSGLPEPAWAVRTILGWAAFLLWMWGQLPLEGRNASALLTWLHPPVLPWLRFCLQCQHSAQASPFFPVRDNLRNYK